MRHVVSFLFVKLNVVQDTLMLTMFVFSRVQQFKVILVL